MEFTFSHFLKIFTILLQANFFVYVAYKLIWIHHISANILYLVRKIADFEISSFECNTFENLQFRYYKRPFVWQVPASPIPIPYYSLDLQEQALRVIPYGAGGKPSTWFSPEGLVELAAIVS